METEKIVVFVTHGSENPEKASIAFVMANAALAMDSEVTVILQSNGVLIAKKGCYEHMFAAGFDPLKKLVDTFIELGSGDVLTGLVKRIERDTRRFALGNPDDFSAIAV